MPENAREYCALPFLPLPPYSSKLAKNPGATWFRRGLQSSAGHAEVLDPRKTARNKLNANDERFALAA
jgi:hypothetical protein